MSDAIAGRRVRSAVFTTFSFDPGFFELHVLPLLFDQSFSQVDKVRLLQLEDALRAVDRLAVYYDRSALAQDAEPARLAYARVDVRRATGVFHPKLVLLLVESPPEEDDSPRHTLLVAALSANLTRAGWWENVECGHVEEIPEALEGDERLSFRGDLLAILRRIRRVGGAEDDHSALDAVRDFLRDRAPMRQYAYASSGGRYHTRLFGGLGDQSLGDWLAGLGFGRRQWNLEIVSPYVDPTGAGPVAALTDALAPRETRVYLPTDADGTALVSEATYRAVSELGVRWSELPSELVRRGRGEHGERLAPRRVHAKVYRLWRRGEGQALLVGSVNLTRAGHSHGGAGNLEAAFLVDASNQSPRWWLEPLEVEAERFVEDDPREDEGLYPAPVDLSLRFDWGTGRGAYRVAGDAGDGLVVTDLSGMTLFAIDAPEPGVWTPLAEEADEALCGQLQSSSFVRAVQGNREWRVLVREEGMAYRPSLLSDLTPEEILQYWSLLTADQRAAFIEGIAGLDVALEGLPVRQESRLAAGNTLFERFAGVYHAFGCLRRHVTEALESGRLQEAEARLFGAKYDSLPVLLERSLEREVSDPVLRYVTFLSARQLRDTLLGQHCDLLAALGIERRRSLDRILERLPEVRSALPLADRDEEAFLDWFERAFLEDLSRTVSSDADDHT